ncbi:pYEATS domain-containing protein [Amycolatopsis sp. NPDC059021]|uniref:pYEATS domain-containing protein n=1 Tax=Amycolatopsis sp. NPDC059021 TaxID=3346704 RepID=UPI00366F437C
MKDWIPLLQSLIWPIFIALLVFAFRSAIRTLLKSVNERVAKGDHLEVGPGGVKLRAESPAAPSGEEPQPGAQPALDGEEPVKSQPHIDVEPLSRFHLVHTAHRDTSLDRGDYRYFRIRVFLEGEEDSDLDRVTKVVYYLHPTFYDPIRTVTDRATKFELTTAAWGMFALRADVHLDGQPTPLHLERYLNF